MEDDFLEELDRRVSVIDPGLFWEKRIGDHDVVMIPIEYKHQTKVKEILTRSKSPDPLEETRRYTVCAVLVGLDGLDFREKRSQGKVFKYKNKDGKNEVLDLVEYLYRKSENWDAEFIEATFRVFTDLMETHSRNLVKDVKFENLKSPREELAELEMQAAELRERLKLPPLVEKEGPFEEESDVPDDVQEDFVLPNDEEDDVEHEEPEAVEEVAPPPPVRKRPAPPVEDDFDPFKQVASAPLPETPISVPVPVPVPSITPRIKLPDGIKPYQAQPSVDVGVVERPAERVVAELPKIDQNIDTQNRNPRFSRPT